MIGLTLVGWLLLGGTAGYATERWKIVYVIVLAWLGVSLIMEPQFPGLIGTSGDGSGGSWLATIAFVVGITIGGLIARREQRRDPS